MTRKRSFRLFNSLRGKLLVAFLSFPILGIALALVAGKYFSLESSVREFNAQVDDLLVNCFELFRHEQAFLQFDQIDPSFFQTGTSRNLVLHRESRVALDEGITNLHRALEARGWDAEDDRIGALLKETRRGFENYEHVFLEYLALTRQRGFKDAGLVGRMRENAHAIENEAVGIEKVDLLMLRRHEKDYIIRKDLDYASKLFALADRLKSELENTGPEARRTLSQLERYQGDFSRVVEVETQMGLNGQEGKLGRLRVHGEALIDLAGELSREMTEEVLAVQAQQGTFFVGLFGAGLIIALVFGLFFSRYITQPLRRLQAAVSQTIQSNFESHTVMLSHRGNDEVGALTRDFEAMLAHLHLRWQKIQQQSKRLEQLNKELAQVNQTLERSREDLQKTHLVKDKIFSIVSHDFRSPLQAIQGYLALLEADAETMSRDKLQAFAGKINQKIRALLNVLENTLQWSLQESGQLKMESDWHNLKEVVAEAVSLHEEQATQKSVQIHVDVSESLVVWADQRMVQFILRNLISNAIKFSRLAKSVKVTARRRRQHVRVQVSDEGVGMTPQQIEKVLDRHAHYSTTGTNDELGTGFGIALCMAFVARHGGELQIESAPEQGTTVSFELPVQDYAGRSPALRLPEV